MSSKERIFILGLKTMANQAIAAAISKELGTACTLCKNPKDLPGRGMNGSQCVVLCDAASIDYTKLLSTICKENGEVSSSCRLAIFNVRSDAVLEESLLSFGITGVFYENDSLEQLMKGIQGMFSGELWLRRRTLDKLVRNAYASKNMKAAAPIHLTPREMQILALVGSGATNDEIATQLYISPHTVKTHLYNVFKKIEVPNRLQAALWVAKHI